MDDREFVKRVRPSAQQDKSAEIMRLQQRELAAMSFTLAQIMGILSGYYSLQDVLHTELQKETDDAK